MRVNIVTLGCSKNLVDSEFIGARLERAGYRVEYDSGALTHDIAIINTCGFITPAKEESINTILAYVQAQEEGKIGKLYVTGCLSQRYREDLKQEIPEVRRYFGVHDTADLLQELKVDYRKELIGERKLATPGHYAYMKIAEGCNRNCAFCAIPLIRGRQQSVPMEELVQQARNLTEKGVKELLLIAQDLSAYGVDLYQERKLADLVEKLSDIEALHWLRLHYLYPLQFSEKLIGLIKERSNICRYVDIPLQHISNNMLRRMKRGNTQKGTYKLLERLRSQIPDLALRTTLLVGYPGETEQDFKELEEFVRTMRFDRLGVFPYYHEEDTPAWRNGQDDVPESLKEERKNRLMEIQQDIAAENNAAKVGKTLEVLIDRQEGEWWIGRSQYDSPEVDGEVLISRKQHPDLQPGSFYHAQITDAEDYDLYASVQE